MNNTDLQTTENCLHELIKYIDKTFTQAPSKWGKAYEHVNWVLELIQYMRSLPEEEVKS